MKEDILASITGNDRTQLKISRLEGKPEIEPEILDEVARVLTIPVDAIKNFDEDAAISIVANTTTASKIKQVFFNGIINRLLPLLIKLLKY